MFCESQLYGLDGSARNRGHKQYLVAFLEGIGLSAEEANIFLVHVDVEEATNLALIIAQVRLQLGEFLIQHREEFREIRGGAGDRTNSLGVTAQCGWNLYCDRHIRLQRLRLVVLRQERRAPQLHRVSAAGTLQTRSA